MKLKSGSGRHLYHLARKWTGPIFCSSCSLHQAVKVVIEQFIHTSVPQLRAYLTSHWHTVLQTTCSLTRCFADSVYWYKIMKFQVYTRDWLSLYMSNCCTFSVTAFVLSRFLSFSVAIIPQHCQRNVLSANWLSAKCFVSKRSSYPTEIIIFLCFIRYNLQNIPLLVDHKRIKPVRKLCCAAIYIATTEKSVANCSCRRAHLIQFSSHELYSIKCSLQVWHILQYLARLCKSWYHHSCNQWSRRSITKLPKPTQPQSGFGLFRLNANLMHYWWLNNVLCILTVNEIQRVTIANNMYSQARRQGGSDRSEDPC